MLLLSLSLMLSGCQLFNQIRLINANNGLEPIWQSLEQKSKLDARFHGEQLYVQASINGIDGFTFLVDTGASIPCLSDTPKVKALNLTPEYNFKIGGNGNQDDSPAFAAKVNSFQMGPALFEEMTFCVIPLKTSQYYLREDEALFDGVIGDDLLTFFTMQVDAGNSEVFLFNGDYVASENEQGLAFDKFMGHIYVETEVILPSGEVIEAEMIVDSGSRNYLKLNDELLDRLSVGESKQITAADFGLSGKSEHKRAAVPQFNFGKFQLKDVKANFIYSDDDDDITFVIGNGILNQFVVTYDYGKEKIWLKETERVQEPSKFNLVGVQLRKTQSGSLVVRNVIPELPAAQYDFSVGDLITKIDNVNTVNISLSQWLSISSTPKNITLCRQREDEQCFQFNTQYWHK